MCEANVYIIRGGQEELLMEKVDRVIPGEDNMIVMENVFGERKIVKARIREMELVHHRIVLDEIDEQPRLREWEIWLEPATDHGHFHAGEEVRLNLFKGYNMQADKEAGHLHAEIFSMRDGVERQIDAHHHHGNPEINLEHEADGLITVYARESGERELYAKVIVEIGHHHHRGIHAVGLPLEIVPREYSHVHLGENYEIQVLKDGKPLAGVEVLATYSTSLNREYPFRLTTDENGRARVFLTARGNWLFSVKDEDVTSTYTLIKSF
ncbi:MAG: CooT family nickel-binding protein [Acidobacteriota bacterium]